MKNILILFLLLLFIFSCTHHQEQKPPNVFAPKIVEAKGYVVPKDSIAEPKIIPVDESKLTKTPVGKPIVIPANTNIHIAGKPKIVPAGIPKVCIPGQDSFLLPQSIPAIDSPFTAGMPEVVTAKDAGVKDQNPQNFSSFSILQGLKHTQIRCLLQDQIGNLWLGTYGGGVTKYDGKSFTHFTEKEGLSDNTIFSLLQDQSGNLWFGTRSGGVTKYDGKSFTHFAKKEGLSNHTIYSILQDKNGNIWFTTDGDGVSKYDGKSFTHFTKKEGLSNNDVYSILQDKNGNIWFGTDGGGVSKYDGQSFIHFTEKEGLSNNVVFSILQDRNGDIWFGTEDGVSKYDGKTFTHFTEEEGLSNNIVMSILEDQDENLWFGTDGGGVSKYDGKTFTHFTEKEGLSNNSVMSILQDRSRNLWLGTYGGGLSKYDGGTFTHFTEKDGLNNKMVFSILEDKSGNIWLGTDGGGASKYDRKSFTHFTEKEGLSKNRVFDILEDKSGNFWFATQGGGASKYDGKFFTHFTEKEGLSRVINCLLQDNSGNLWFGTFRDGVIKYDGKSFTHFTVKEGLSDNTVYSILQDKSGNLWFGTHSGGVSKYDGSSFTHFTVKEGLSNNRVLSILQDRNGDIWFSTYGGGISKYDGKYFTHFTEKEGLNSNTVLSALQDKGGNLWFATRFGLNKLTPANLIKLSGNTKVPANKLEISDHANNLLNHNVTENVFFKSFTYEDGFLGIGCIRNSICEDKNGTIWIGCNDRLTAYHPEGDERDTIAPGLQLTSIELFNESIDWGRLKNRKDSSLVLGNGAKIDNFKFEGLTRWYNLPEKLSLAYNNNYLTFNYTGIKQKQNKKVKYQYKLEGADENWSAITGHTQAAYSTLSPGSYIFKVRAMNSEGYWSNEFHYAFTIRPPWWKTWWAYSLYFLAIAGSIAYYIKWREKLLKKRQKKLIEQHDKEHKLKTEVTIQTQEKERNELGRELHDNINQILVTVKLYLSMAKTKEEIPKELVGQSYEYVNVAIEEIRKLSHTLVAPSLGDISLKEALQELADDANLLNHLQVQISVDEKYNEKGIDKNKELMFYRIVQEQLNNIIKYAKAKKAVIGLTKDDKNLVLSVSDDGVGFDTAQKSRGIGLKNISNRVEFYSGSINIASAPGKGCKLEVCIPD
ncbi:MAG TPA: two-component regulator propeller domain-containing protein [Chitinophagaceae bacterium]